MGECGSHVIPVEACVGEARKSPPRNGPQVKYTMGTFCSCCFSSLASALDYFGDSMAAARVAQFTAESMKRHSKNQRMKFAVQVMVGEHRKPGEKRIVYSVDKKWLDEEFDPLDRKNESSFPTLVQLVDSVGGVKHAVTICDQWIFDSNFPNALPLEQQWLDYICDSVSGRSYAKVKYHHVRLAYRFCPSKPFLIHPKKI